MPEPAIPYSCPQCHGPVTQSRPGFIEIGEWDGKAYAVEGTLQGYHCPRCALEFFLNDIPETSPASPEPVT